MWSCYIPKLAAVKPPKTAASKMTTGNLNMSTNLLQTTYIESLDLSNQTIPVILSNLSSKCEEQLSDHGMIRTVIYAKPSSMFFRFQPTRADKISNYSLRASFQPWENSASDERRTDNPLTLRSPHKDSLLAGQSRCFGRVPRELFGTP